MIGGIIVDGAELSRTVLEKTSEGFGIINMFMSEPGNGPARVNVVMRRGADIQWFVSDAGASGFGSISAENPTAEIYERLIHEENGYMPEGLANLTPVRYWRTGNPPLAKDRKADAEERRIPIPHNDLRGQGVFEIPVGPVHAGVIEPGHFRFSVAGEPVIKLKVHLGYVHRGIEKLMEVPASKNMARMAERISGDTCAANTFAYSQVIEGDTCIPERASYIRVIAAELERISAHVSAVGGMCTDTAFSVPSARAARLHEDVLRTCYSAFGSRYMRNIIVPGGVRRDISHDELRIIEKSLIELKLNFVDLVNMMMDSSSLMDRLETTGVLRPEIAEANRILGPIGRASGMSLDVRKERPYDGYRDMGLLVPREITGDVLARTKVRIEEVYESIDLVFQAIAQMEPGQIRTKVETPKDGLHLGIVEAPRGELVHCAEIRDGNIWRYSIRDPSLINWPMMSYAVPGNVVPDFPLINKSFSLSYSGNDL